MKTLQEWKDVVRKHKDQLKTIRDECRERFKESYAEIENINLDSIFDTESQRMTANFASRVQNESNHCTQEMIRFAKTVCETSESIMSAGSGSPPCSYAVVALGSMARGEATPYSDLEYAFIVDDSQHKQYFENLAVDTYFRMGNLGETPLKYFYIQELLCVKDGKETLWFKDRGPCGFRIDGLMPKAGNIPTENGLTDDSLILSVDELETLYSESLQGGGGDGGVTGTMADMLTNMECVHSYHDGVELVNEFLCRKVLLDNDNPRAEANIPTLVEDIEKYSEEFCPEDLQVDLRNVEIKADIFRYPTILALDLKVILTLQGQTAWEIYNELHSNGLINQETLDSLVFVLTAAIWIRTSAYLQTDAQKEKITFLPMYEEARVSDRFYAPVPLYIAMACRLVPMKRQILNFVQNQKPPLNIEHIRTGLRSLSSPRPEFLLQTRLHYICGDIKGGLHHLQTALGDEHIADDVFKFMDRVGEDCSSALLLTAYLLFHDGQFSKALPFFHQLCNIEKLQSKDCVRLASFYAAIGQCLIMLGKYQEQKHWFDDAGRQIGHLFGIHKRRDLQHFPNMVKPQNDSEQKKTIQLFCCLHGSFLTDSVRYHQGRNYKARQSFIRLQIIYTGIKLMMEEPKTPNLVVADFDRSFGLYHLEFAEYKQADTALTSAYNIYKNVFGASAVCADLSSINLHLGILAMHRADYTKALQLGHLSLEILRKTGHSTPLQTIAYHQIIAEIHLRRAEYSMALESISSTFHIIDTSTTEGFVFSGAISQVLYARILQQQNTHNADKNDSMLIDAKTRVINAINSLQEVVDEKVRESHPQINIARRALSEILLDLQEISQAQRTAEKALEGSLIARGEDSAHPDTLTLQLLLAKIYLQVGELSSSETLIKKVLVGYFGLFDSDCAHPEVAEAKHLLSEIEAMRGNYGEAWKNACIAFLTLNKVYNADRSTQSHPLLVTYNRSLGEMFNLFMPGVKATR